MRTNLQKRIDRLWDLLHTCEDSESYTLTMGKIQELQEQLNEEQNDRRVQRQGTLDGHTPR